MAEESGRRWCVVTGGRGFAARHLVEMLIRYQMFSVRIADLGPTIQLEPYEEEDGVLGNALRSGIAKYVAMDLCNKADVLKGLEGAEVVFHMAAPNSSINSYKLHHSVNVQGTQNVIDACVELKVKRLIYTSSPSVVSDGVRGIFNGNETLPYPAKHNDTYSATKAEGEALVIKSNGKNGLLTCCIRPSSIFGPGDRLLVPSLVSAARAGKSKFIIGNGQNLYDFTYVENVAHAHICAERALASEGTAEKAAGQAYFITNSDPIKFWEFVSLILEGLGYQRPSIKIPAVVLMPIAYIVELVYKLFGPLGMKVPQLTPSRIRLISQSRTFSCSKACDRIGYTPIVPLQEGIRKTIDSYQHLRSGWQSKEDVSSKASKPVRERRAPVSSLWRNKKKTSVMMILLVAFYFHFVASGYTIVTAVAKLLLVATIFLFINGILPQKLFGYKIQKIDESKFHVSEDMSQQLVGSVTLRWNSAMSGLKSICTGNDYMLFFKVVFFLSVISLLGAISFRTLFVIVLPIALVALIVYEKKGDEIDRQVLTLGGKFKSIITKKSFNDKKER